MIQSVPHLLAVAHGGRCVGESRCCYCGAPCDGSNPSKTYVLPSFTAVSSVARPGSDAVCDGCVLALREDFDVPFVDGTSKRVTKGATRAYSWIIHGRTAVAASKAHMAELRAACLAPPDPPYAIVLSDSGQTHQIYRGVVGRSNTTAVVTLEGERIDYHPVELDVALSFTGSIAAACGKPALASRLSVVQAARVIDRYGADHGETILDQWGACGRSPLYRLAAWLTPKMEDCKVAYPGDR